MQFSHVLLAVIAAAAPALANGDYYPDCGGGRAPVKTTVPGCPGYVEPTTAVSYPVMESPSPSTYVPEPTTVEHPVEKPTSTEYPAEETPVEVSSYPVETPATTDTYEPTTLVPTYAAPSYTASVSAAPSAPGNATENPKPSGSAVPSAVPEGGAGHVLPGTLSVLAVVAAGMMLA